MAAMLLISINKRPMRGNRKDNFERHLRSNCKATSSGAGVKRPFTLLNPETTFAKTKSRDLQFKINTVDQAFGGAAETYRITYNPNMREIDMLNVMEASVFAMEGKLSQFVRQNRELKFTMSIHALFTKVTDESITTNPPACFTTQAFDVYHCSNIHELLIHAQKQLLNRINTYESQGSGWILSGIKYLDTSAYVLDPLRASSYQRWIINKRAVVNVQNEDQECFKWAVLAGLHKPREHVDRVLSYQRILDDETVNTPDFSMLKFPVSLKQIKKFEDANNVSVNVYGVADDDDDDDTAIDDDIADRDFIAVMDDDAELVVDDVEMRDIDVALDDDDDDVRRNVFIDDEAGGDDDDEVDDDIDDQYLVDLIDDGELVDDVHLHRILDQQHNLQNLNDVAVPVAPPADSVLPVDQKRGTIFPLRVADQDVENRHVNLLVTEQYGNWDYSTITGFSRLVRSQVTKYEHKHFFSYRCLHRFTRQDLLDEHVQLCNKVDAQRVKMPTRKEKIMKFNNIHKQLRAPFTVYADFECLLKTLDVETSPLGIIEETNETDSRTTKFQEHVPCSYAYKVVSDIPEYQPELKHELCQDTAAKFIKEMNEIADHIMTEFILKPKPKPRYSQLSAEEKHRHDTGDCHICGKAFPGGHNVPRGKRRVIDHCHFTSEPGQAYGKYRGPAHLNCNLRYKIDPKSWKLSVIIHNLKGYDSRLIIKALQKSHGSIKLVPNNMEKYMSMSIGQVRYIDSIQFMGSRLGQLVENLTSSDLHFTRMQFPDLRQFELVKKKGVYPYDYFNSFDRFAETELPDRDAFKNILYDTEITDVEFQRAHDVWTVFECNSLEDYHDVYLKSDITLLADVFEKFRKMCLNTYGLDLVHYLSAPGLAFDAALKLTRIKLQLLTDINMHLFIEKSIRGAVSMISTRHAKANHSLLPDFDMTKELQHLIYLACNNLYGYAMSQALPTGKFRWLSQIQIENQFPIISFKDNLLQIPISSRLGYIFEVDLQYHHRLHDDHSDYPLAPENIKITDDMYSPFMKENFDSSTKLTPNLMDKEKYTVHYRNLQLYLDLGMEVTKIHRVLQFEQSPWLKPYINLNTEKRSCASNEFEKNFFKLMNNAVFGKTMENIRKRVNIDIVTDRNIFKKRVAKPAFKRVQVIREDLAAIECCNTSVTLNRPIICGFTVPELSKWLMYQFHYNHMKKVYPPEKLNLLFTDTDSLTYAVKTENIYRDMAADALEKYDFSEYPLTHHLYDDFNKKDIGFFKDERNSLPLEEFAGLRPKCYS